MQEEFSHLPVMAREVVELLLAVPGGLIIDGTVGGGGHAEAILDRIAPSGLLLGLDVDPAALDEARRVLARFRDRAVLDDPSQGAG